MLYAYLTPILFIFLFFLSTFFLMDWLAKMFLYTYIVIVPLLPFYLLYKQEVTDKSRAKLEDRK